jgi:signal transduction histidine kinase
MKLRHKISLLAGSILLLVLLICAGALLLYARKTILALAEDQAKDKQSALAASFSSMARYYSVPEDSDAARESLIRYCFTQFADQEGVLMRGSETLCSSVSVDPSLYAQPDREDARTAVYQGKVDGRQLLIVASLEWVQADTLYVGLVRDITEVYDAMARLTHLFLLVCAAGVVLGMGLLFFAVKKSTAPLSRLTAATGEIAAGAYDKRVTVSGRDEVSDLGRSFNQMAEAVENKIADLTEQNERQRLFIGGVSHEFKTPLAAVRLHGDLLQSAKLSEAEREDSLQHIRRAGAYMTSMTQSLMELLLLDQGIETEETDPADLLTVVESAIRGSLAARGVMLVIDRQVASPLLLNRTLMTSLLLNLIENAARSYDPEDGDKTVTLRACGRCFEVSDHGRGIPAEAQARIFEPFYRVDKSRSRKQGGSGLGLALVKAIADAHGATLSLQSEPGRGTTFRAQF